MQRKTSLNSNKITIIACSTGSESLTRIKLRHTKVINTIYRPHAIPSLRLQIKPTNDIKKTTLSYNYSH